MSEGQPVRFEPVTDREDAEQASPSPTGRERAMREREAERDPYPLAGPILEQAGSTVLRGRCSSCEARLRVSLDASVSGRVRVRCTICGKTREIEV